MLSDKIFRFILRDNAEVELRYLDYILKSPALRGQIEKVATGTSPTMKNISKGKTLALSIPPHDLFAQREIIAELDELQAYVDDLRHLQIECATELDALLPSVLDRAFRGEL
jgi:type I restriction enzyme S subunit